MKLAALFLVYAAIFVYDTNAAFLASPLLGLAAQSFWALPASLMWLAAPVVDHGGDPSAADYAGEWNPMPVIVFFVIPVVTGLIAAGVVVRRVAKTLRSRRAAVRGRDHASRIT